MPKNDKSRKRAITQETDEESTENQPQSSENGVKKQKRSFAEQNDEGSLENQPSSCEIDVKEIDEESPENQPKKIDTIALEKKKFKGESDEKSLLKRRSDERRQHANLFGICLTCYQYGTSTLGEMSSFAYEHMCDLNQEPNENGLKEAIKILETHLSSIKTK